MDGELRPGPSNSPLKGVVGGGSPRPKPLLGVAPPKTGEAPKTGGALGDLLPEKGAAGSPGSLALPPENGCESAYISVSSVGLPKAPITVQPLGWGYVSSEFIVL